MSKAFTKEDAAAEDIVVPARPPLPPGARNYVTPRGLELLRKERRSLDDARSQIEALSDEASRARALAAWSLRVAELEQRLASAELVEPAHPPGHVVRFGSRVTVSDPEGREREYEIVGVDEADPAQGKVAFLSSIARCLLGARVGDAVTFRKPGGVEELEIVALS